MMTPTVYLDTSVINFLFATDAPQLQAATVAFFERYVRAGKYRAVVSDFVLQELNQTTDPRERAALIDAVDEYAVEAVPTMNVAEVTRLAELYLRTGALPPKKLFDALHVAFCVVERLDYLASWNYKHLANVQRERRLMALNLQEGYLHPLRIITPLELLTDEA